MALARTRDTFISAAQPVPDGDTVVLDFINNLSFNSMYWQVEVVTAAGLSMAFVLAAARSASSAISFQIYAVAGLMLNGISADVQVNGSNVELSFSNNTGGDVQVKVFRRSSL